MASPLDFALSKLTEISDNVRRLADAQERIARAAEANAEHLQGMQVPNVEEFFKGLGDSGMTLAERLAQGREDG